MEFERAQGLDDGRPTWYGRRFDELYGKSLTSLKIILKITSKRNW
jgi:hypothetical protein